MTSSLPDYTEHAAAPSVSYATFDYGRNAFRDNWVPRIDRQLSGAQSRVLTRRTLAAAIGCLLVSACTEDSGPQFASNPIESTPAAKPLQIATPLPQPTSPPVATPGSIAEVLMSRGAPGRMYFMAGQNVWTSSADGDVKRVYAPGEAESILDIAAAPNGEQVAILVERAASTESLNVLVVDAAGTLQRQIEVESHQAIATPVVAASAPGIDWSPQGDHLLVLLRDGNIVSAAIGAEGSPVPNTLKAAGEDIRSAAWSPTGESIAYLAVAPASRSRSLVVENVVSGVSLPVIPASDERSVVEFAWMPDGAALLFTEGNITGGAVSGVDLWRVAADGTNRQLVASAGSVAPVARITVVRPSPDGRRVAYAVLVPGDDSPRFDSIWVRDLASRTGYEVATPSIAGVDDIWWTAAGLLVLADEQPSIPGEGSAPMLLHVPKDGVAEIVWRMPRPAGTPTAATPAATPVSS